MLNIVSWNVRYFSHPTRGITSTDRGLRRIAKALADLDPQPDVIALQEIDEQSLRSALVRATRRSGSEPASPLDRFVSSLNDWSLARGGHLYQTQFYPAHGHDRRLPLISTGLAILYRSSLEQLDHNGHDPLDITHRRISRLGSIKQKRICAWSRFRDPRRQTTFDVFNTHLSLPAFLQRAQGPNGRRFGEADNQLREVDRVLEFTMRRGRPETTLLVGDFNALPGSRVYNRITGSTLLRDAHADHLGLATHEMERLPSAGFMNLRYRLDHIFSGPEVRFTDFRHTRPFGADHPMRGLSDHVPLVGRFSIY